MLTINFEQTEIPYEIRRSKKAKRGRIVVSAGKVEVVAPTRMSDRKINRFVDENKSWIKKKYIETGEKAANAIKPLPDRFTAGEKVMLQGKYIPLHVSENGKKNVEHKGWLFINAPENERKDLAIDWLKEQARIEVLKFIEKHKSRFDLDVGKVLIKNQKQRWGSCGRNNSININWQLIFYPPEMLEYVVVHELCHIRHKNHSKRFWDFVEDHMPDYKTRRKWLRKNANILDFS